VPGIDTGRVSKRKEHCSDRGQERLEVASWQVGAADGAGEERVADEQVLSGRPARPYLETHATGTMAGRMVRRRQALPERDRLAGLVELIDRRLRLHAQAEHPSHLDRLIVEKEIISVQIDRDAQRPLRRRHAGDVIDMSVGEQNVFDRELAIGGDREQLVDLVARIDQHRFAGRRARHNEAVLEEGPNRSRLDYDHAVILAILDDLMFTSKIKTAAGQLGVAVSFARSAQAALADMRARTPALVILDLNNPRTDPLGTVGVMKGDPELARIPTVGFASHVQTDVIEAARRAGVDEVLARSTFTQRLPEILARGL
jgi:CheY-like chemotaxis protein